MQRNQFTKVFSQLLFSTRHPDSDQQTSSLPSDSSSYETAKSDVVEQNSSNDGNSSDQSLVESVNRASNSTKRQRTFTATLSEGETQAM